MVIAGVYHRIKNQDNLIVKAGKATIIMVMLFVVGNNLIVIGSATTSYSIVTPNSLEYPGRVETDGSLTYAFTMANGTYAYEFGTPEVANGTLGYATNIRVTAGFGGATIKYVLTDWAHPNRIYIVDSLKNVLFTDQLAPIDYTSTGYKEYGANPDSCPSCDEIYRIGVLSSLNTKMSGYVDSLGDIYIAEGLTIQKFTRASDFTKSTYLTLVAGTDFTSSSYTQCYSGQCYATNIIQDINLDSSNNLHILVGSSAQSTCNMCGASVTTYITHVVYTGLTRVYTNTLVTTTQAAASQTTHTDNLETKMILPTSTNFTQVILANLVSGAVKLRYYNGSAFSDICPTSCASATSVTGLSSYNDGYIYIASSAQNYVYRYPTTLSLYSGTGYVPGAGAESTDQPELTYTTKSINSLYANYYNFTKFSIQSTILFDSGFWILGSNYGVDSQNYRWQIHLVDPNGATVNSWDSPACTDSLFYGTCSLSIDREYTAPSGGWMAGNWYVKLYEHKVGSSLVGAEVGNLALLTTSATWNVYNASVSANNTGIIGNPTESLTSISNQATIAQFDWIVALMGLGVNSVSKFLFALIIIVIMFVVGLIWGNGNIGLALSTIPYTFFTYIEYVPKWVFIIYIIMLIVISKVFR
jgi:hypothetical protein